jgi:hypothetical protein
MNKRLKDFWLSFRSWLFTTVFREEAQTLQRYRRQVKDLEEWFPYYVPEVATAARWVRQYSEPRLEKGDYPSGLDIHRLRDLLFHSRSKTRRVLDKEQSSLSQR